MKQTKPVTVLYVRGQNLDIEGRSPVFRTYSLPQQVMGDFVITIKE
jgi:hypothetical protein